MPRNPTPAIVRRRHAPLASWLARPGAIWRLLTRRDAPWLPKVVVLATLAYVVFPFDLVPDVLPVVGWLDDLGIVGIAATFVLSQAARYAEREQQLAPVTSR